MKTIAPLLFAACLVLCACGKASPPIQSHEASNVSAAMARQELALLISESKNLSCDVSVNLESRATQEQQRRALQSKLKSWVLENAAHPQTRVASKAAAIMHSDAESIKGAKTDIGIKLANEQLTDSKQQLTDLFQILASSGK